MQNEIVKNGKASCSELVTTAKPVLFSRRLQYSIALKTIPSQTL